jgi:hypothetical protein|tara:strand:+ start:31 stop:258 length:228 start_codon:yes stop_codon:yes gene_type:complete
MQYELSIPKENRQAHIDIESDIRKRKNGLFTFIIRVDEGKITDYTLMEYVDAKSKYLNFATVAFEQQIVSRYHRA